MGSLNQWRHGRRAQGAGFANARMPALCDAPRRLWVRLHRWSGLCLAALLLVAGLTGAAVAFRPELDRVLNADLYTVPVPSSATTLPLDQLIQRVQQRYPDAEVFSVSLQRNDTDALKMSLRTRGAMSQGNALQAQGMHTHGQSLKVNEVFVDPYRGELLGARNTRDFQLSRHGLMPSLIRLHTALLLDKPGLYLMGGAALVWLISMFIGLALSWPADWQRFATWRTQLSVRTHAGRHKLNFDLHRSVGLLSLPIMLVIAFSGAYMNLPDIAKPAVTTFSPLFKQPVASRVLAQDITISPEQAIAMAYEIASKAQANTNFHAVSFAADLAKGWYAVRLLAPSDPSPRGNNVVYINPQTGRVLATQFAVTGSAGDTFANWQWPLHSGRAFGVIGQLVILQMAIVVCGLIYTGVRVWWRHFRQRNCWRRSFGLRSLLNHEQKITAVASISKDDHAEQAHG